MTNTVQFKSGRTQDKTKTNRTFFFFSLCCFLVFPKAEADFHYHTLVSCTFLMQPPTIARFRLQLNILVKLFRGNSLVHQIYEALPALILSI